MTTRPVGGADFGPAWVAGVVAELRRVMDEPDLVARGPLMASLVELHRINVAQWDLEDAARVRDVSDRALADVKRSIDLLNPRRHQFIEAVDDAIDAVIDQAGWARPSTESPGMVFDRLSVLVIRIHHTQRASSARPDGDRYAQRLPKLNQQLAVLQQALGDLLQEVSEGKRRFLPYRGLKLYGT